MGIMKAIAIELEELEADVNFDWADDVFDLVIDTQLYNTKLSSLMIKAIWSQMFSDRDTGKGLDRLWDSQEFLDGMAWHEVAA
jgi:hypothetical protein